MNEQIIAAAEIIGQFDQSLANLFLSRPFHRHAAVSALHQSLSKSANYASMADRIAVTLRSAIDTVKYD